MKHHTLILLSFICLITPIPCLSIEILNNETLSMITGQAVTDNPALNLPTIAFTPDITLPGLGDTSSLTSYSQGNSGVYKTVAIEFLGKEKTDPNGHPYRASFTSEAEIKDVLYQNISKTSFVAFEGSVKGRIVIPEYFDDNPAIKTKELNVSNLRINLLSGVKGDYICSFQGHIFTKDFLTDIDRKFTITPNKQTITVGFAGNNDLTILVPHGYGDSTVWEPVIKTMGSKTSEPEYLVIPKGQSFIQIALNNMSIRTDLSVKIRLGHTNSKWMPSNDNPLPPDMGQTLGTASMFGGDIKINGGNIIITSNSSL